MLILRSFIVMFAVLLLTVPSFAQQRNPRAEIDAFVKPFVEKGHFFGVILAKKDGRVVYEKAFGYANADFSIPNRMSTRIGIASITKPMTVVILLRMIEAKKLAPEDKVSKFIPDFPNGDKITVDHLARHRAGIPHRVMPPEMETISYTSDEVVDKIKAAKLDFEPGEKTLYSSGGFALLARILEIASGKPYASLLEEYVFAPAGMKDSIDFPGEAIIERRAQDYLRDDRGPYNAPLKDYTFLIGAGSVFSTAGDVFKFGEAVANGTYGEEVRGTYLREGVVSSSGSTNGHRAYLKIDTNNKYGYVLLANMGTGAFDLISAAIDTILAGKIPDPPMVPSPKIEKWTEAKLAEFLGSYKRDGSGGGFEMKLRNGVMYADDIKLLPSIPDCFWDYKFYGDVCAARDDAGKITHLTWASPGLTSKWVRQ